VFEEAHRGMVVIGRQLLVGVWCSDSGCLSESGRWGVWWVDSADCRTAPMKSLISVVANDR
jgi:hypothetical protein